MSVFDTLPTFSFFGGIRYEAYSDRMRKQIGSINTTWGLPKAPSQPTLTDTASGSMDAGVYKVMCVGETAWNDKGMPFSNTPQSVTLAAGSHKIAVTNIPVFSDPQIKYVSLWRTPKDALSPFSFAGRVVNGVTSLDLNGSDDSLSATDVLEPPESLAADEGAYAGPFRYEPPPAKSRCFSWDGRAWVFGEKELRLGRITATVGSKIMLGSAGVYFTPEMVGKYIVLENEEVGYEIDKVYSATIVGVTQNYALPPFLSAAVANSPFYVYGDPYEVRYSETDKPEYFPWCNTMLVGQEEGGVIKAGCQFMGEAIFFSEASIFAVYRTGSDETPYGIRKTLSSAGCSAPNSVVNAGPVVYFYDGRRFRGFANNQSEKIDMDLGTAPESLRDDMRKHIKGCVVGDRVYWAVPVDPDGDWLDEIWVYDTKNGFWDMPWKDLRIVDLEGVVNDKGAAELWVETVAATGFSLHKFDASCLADGVVAGADHSGTVDSAGSTSLTDASASFPTSGLKLRGVKVQIVAGTGLGQKRWISDNTTTRLTIDKAWTTVPDTTSRYTIGGLDHEIESGHLNVGRPHDEKRMLHAEFGFQGDRDE